MERTRLERAPYIRVFLFDIQHPTFFCGSSYKILKISLVIYTGNKRKTLCAFFIRGDSRYNLFSFVICCIQNRHIPVRISRVRRRFEHRFRVRHQCRQVFQHLLRHLVQVSARFACCFQQGCFIGFQTPVRQAQFHINSRQISHVKRSPCRNTLVR